MNDAATTARHAVPKRNLDEMKSQNGHVENFKKNAHGVSKIFELFLNNVAYASVIRVFECKNYLLDLAGGWNHGCGGELVARPPLI